MADLYEFPADYIGRKVYVSVRGHSRSIPKFKTYRGNEGRNYIRPDDGGDWSGLAGGAPTIIPDKAGYYSPIDGKYYDGRAAHRDHNARHNVYEAGDMKIGEFSGRENSPLPSMRDSIRQAYSEVNLRS